MNGRYLALTLLFVAGCTSAATTGANRANGAGTADLSVGGSGTVSGLTARLSRGDGEIIGLSVTISAKVEIGNSSRSQQPLYGSDWKVLTPSGEYQDPTETSEFPVALAPGGEHKSASGVPTHSSRSRVVSAGLRTSA